MNKLRANLVFDIDLKSMWKSVWIGALLITWLGWFEELDWHWYGFDYWHEPIVLDVSEVGESR